MQPKTTCCRLKSMWKLFGEEEVKQQSELGIRGRRGSAAPRTPQMFRLIKRPTQHCGEAVKTELITMTTTHARTRSPPPHVYLKHAQTRRCRFHVQVKGSDAARGPSINGRGGGNRRRREEGGVGGVALRALGVDLRTGPGTELGSPQPATEKWKTHLKEQSSRALQHGFFLLWEKPTKTKKKIKSRDAETMATWE